MLFPLCLSVGAQAVGLGELRGQPVLGERLALTVDLLGAGRPLPDASCFRVVPPPGSGDLPWLKKAVFSVRPGVPPAVEIRSDLPLSEPIVQLAIELGCGHDISRLYVLLASPAVDRPRVVESAPLASLPAPADGRLPALSLSAPSPQVRPAPRRSALPRLPAGDRLLLSGGSGNADLPLRLATEIAVGDRLVKEAQRDILRLEFRMLMAMSEQGAAQLAAAEKLRRMEEALGDLRRQAADFAGRVEQGEGGAVTPSTPAVPPPSHPAASREPAGEASWLSEWSLYGALLGVLLGVGGWLGWQNYSSRRYRQDSTTFDYAEDQLPPRTVKPAPAAARAAVDLPLETALDTPTHVDFELEGGGSGTVGVTVAEGVSASSVFQAPQEAQVEVNPVMELAEIMLSFGRVKGAAQTLQEYIDNNPQDALQPWIRLMDVYRMAGMREEFENVARNLHLHFNVEVQTWDAAAEGTVESILPARPQSLEDMPRLMNKVVELWNTGDVVGYLYQLLRDNRGGERIGFAMPVVDDILFLVELKETANRLE